jgi:hypothetical protein
MPSNLENEGLPGPTDRLYREADVALQRRNRAALSSKHPASSRARAL